MRDRTPVAVRVDKPARPYAESARTYRDLGWEGVIPVDLGKPGAVPPGVTGRNGSEPDDEEVRAWTDTHGARNVGLRLPEDVVGIDIDCYDGKLGCDTLDWWEVNAGLLPATWSSTSRHDGSRILFYRVPTGRRWKTELPEGGVEIIQHGHRWARVWPSLNPKTGQPYRWFTPDASEAGRPPRVDELAELPDAWVEALAKRTADGGTSADSPIAGISTGDLLAGVPEGQRHNRLLSVAGRLWAQTGDREVVAVQLLHMARNCQPPHPEDDVAKIVDWIAEQPRNSFDVDPDVAAWARGTVDRPVDHQPHAGEDMVTKRLAWYRADREARRILDAEEAEDARGPRPKRTAREYADVPQPAAVISDVLAAEVNLLGGPSEAGKSLLARDWTMCVATGEAWRGYTPLEIRNVLIVASEGLHDFKERWTHHALWERAPDRVYVLDEPVDLVRGDDVDWLLDEYRDERPGLVIFDVIYGMGMVDDNGVKDVGPVIAAMKRISAAWSGATLALGHPPHVGGRRFRGSSMWRQLAAVEWHMADGSLTCEKSKIADKRSLAATYVADYPELRWRTSSDAVASAATQREWIAEDIARTPDESNQGRAERLAPALGLSAERVRKLVAEVKKAL